MTDLLDYRGRLLRFVFAVLIAAPVSVVVMIGFSALIDMPSNGSNALGWCFMFGVPFVFVLTMMLALKLLARLPFRERRAPLPRARLVRR